MPTDRPLTVTADHTFADVPDPAVVIVPGGDAPTIKAKAPRFKDQRDFDHASPGHDRWGSPSQTGVLAWRTTGPWPRSHNMVVCYDAV